MAELGRGARDGREGPRPRGRTSRTVGAVALLVLTATACGGGTPTLPTERPTLPSVTLPTVTLPTLPSVTLPTLPTVTLPTPTLPTVTLPGGSTSAPEPTVPEEPTVEPTAEAPATEDPATAAPEEGEADEGGSGWWWLLILLLLAAAAAVAVALWARRREDKEWWTVVAGPLQESLWLRDTLVPNLLSQSPDGRAGIWAVGRPRTLALEQRLATLAVETRDAARAGRLDALTVAVRALRRTLDQADTLVGFGGASTTAALQQSGQELDEAIRALQPPPDGQPDAAAEGSID